MFCWVKISSPLLNTYTAYDLFFEFGCILLSLDRFQAMQEILYDMFKMNTIGNILYCTCWKPYRTKQTFMLNCDTNKPPYNYKQKYVLNWFCIVVKETNKYIEFNFA